MTGDQKNQIYNLLKSASSWAYGYASPSFLEEAPYFDDDFIEYIEPQPAQSVEPEPIQERQEPPVPSPSSASSTPASPAEPGQKPSGGMTLETLGTKIASCSNCILSRTRKLPAPGQGNLNPYVLVIGEVPTQEDDMSGTTFGGPQGELLDKMLGAIGLGRGANCYITTIVKCRPPMNRYAMTDEIQSCSGFLQTQIRILKPSFILALGRTAAQSLMNTQMGINDIHGKWTEYDFCGNKIPLMAIHSPEALLAQPALKAAAWEDLKRFRDRLQKTRPDYSEKYYVSQK